MRSLELVEKAVYDNLRRAKVIALFHVETYKRVNYVENIYIVAWERDDQCGTHRVCVNNDDEVMCVVGHYDLTRQQALEDLFKRVGITHVQGLDRVVAQ